jgi:hypothetical protein
MSLLLFIYYFVSCNILNVPDSKAPSKFDIFTILRPHHTFAYVTLDLSLGQLSFYFLFLFLVLCWEELEIGEGEEGQSQNQHSRFGEPHEGNKPHSVPISVIRLHVLCGDAGRVVGCILVERDSAHANPPFECIVGRWFGDEVTDQVMVHVAFWGNTNNRIKEIEDWIFKTINKQQTPFSYSISLLSP